jgi:hypothetical protein
VIELTLLPDMLNSPFPLTSTNEESPLPNELIPQLATKITAIIKTE